MTTIYRVGEQQIKGDDPRLAGVLADAYEKKARPMCLCRDPAIPMYIAKVAGKYLVKRMPNSGSEHAPACDSYEPPPELSGLGQVMGSAILENPDDGLTALKLDFSLTKMAGRSAPIPSGAETQSVKTDGTKLTLRGALHYLWDQAGFNRWAPSMAGKRSWYVVRKYLCQAAENKTTKGESLANILYIPESFSAERKDEIAQRRAAHMLAAATPIKGARRLLLAIGEVKEIAPSRYGHKIVFKHLPDCHFMLAEDLHKRLAKRFDIELGLWDALEATHLVAITTASVAGSGIVSVEEVALMIVTENWIPFDQRTQTFSTLTRNLGRFTAATAREKVEPLALARGYAWRARPVHGFGGYWVHANGDTIELLPGRA